MDLLETVLRTANAFEHIEKFRKEGINATALQLLTDNDLEIIGIDDPKVRDKILKTAEHLQVASEKRVELKFDKMYVNTALAEIKNQMLLYNATYTPMVLRPDVINVTVPLANACEALSTAIDDLHQEVMTFKNHVLSEKGLVKTDKDKLTCVISGILLSVFVVTNMFVVKKIVSLIRQ